MRVEEKDASTQQAQPSHSEDAIQAVGRVQAIEVLRLILQEAR